MKESLILEQSNAAYKQWAPQWRKHCEEHAHFKKRSLRDFENTGIGKAVLCVANGFSLEENIETIKKYKHKVDILACDKTMGHLLDNGITPTFVMVCDANVNYEKYMEKWKDKLSNTTLFINACANPQWSHNGNWKNKYFFVNKDIIKSELEFAKISGTPNAIPAGTNVSNAMIILLTQSDNEGRKNWFGYDKILLIGYDYSWKFGGKYYAFNDDGGGKADYMKHNYAVAPNGTFLYTSGNLAFSMEWLTTYIRTFNLPVVQCSKDSLLVLGKAVDLAEQMQYTHKPEDRKPVRDAVEELRKLHARIRDLTNTINNIGRDHYWSYARSI